MYKYHQVESPCFPLGLTNCSLGRTQRQLCFLSGHAARPWAGFFSRWSALVGWFLPKDFVKIFHDSELVPSRVLLPCEISAANRSSWRCGGRRGCARRRCAGGRCCSPVWRCRSETNREELDYFHMCAAWLWLWITDKFMHSKVWMQTAAWAFSLYRWWSKCVRHLFSLSCSCHCRLLFSSSVLFCCLSNSSALRWAISSSLRTSSYKNTSTSMNCFPFKTQSNWLLWNISVG